MPSARSDTVLPGEPGFYHCVSRCVRRAWLCGDDPLTGTNFDHRKGWIEAKLLELAELFAVGVYAYAVMSNHVHLVVFVDPARSEGWSDEEVAERWSQVSRELWTCSATPAFRQARRDALLTDETRLAQVRSRLGSLSRFMRYLNESIARAANREDGCTGRFWEGRFGCKALRDDAAVVGCMSYVDLNPIRAGITSELDDCEYTSARARIRAAEQFPQRLDEAIAQLAGPATPTFPVIDLRSYLELLEHSGRQVPAAPRDRIQGDPPACLARLGCSPRHWLRMVEGMERWFGSAVGASAALTEFARLTGRRWVKGGASAW